MRWNDQQKKVIDIRDKNVLVAAAAGSGKTSVLVERIIKIIIDDKKNIDNFLVMTFTNAAASGMRLKIQKSIYKAMEEINKDDKDMSSHLVKQINMLSNASISTIHSFCIKVLRDNFHVIDLDPNFRIGDDNECKILLEDAIEEVLNEEYLKYYTTEIEDDDKKLEIDEKEIEKNNFSNDEVNKENETPKFLKVVDLLTSNRNDIALVQIINQIYRFIQGFADPMKWYEENLADFNVNNEKDTMLEKEIYKHFKLIIGYNLEILQNKLKVCRLPGGPANYEGNIEYAVEIANNLNNCLEKLIIRPKLSEKCRYNEEINEEFRVRFNVDNIYDFINVINQIEFPALKKISEKDNVDEIKKADVGDAYRNFKEEICKIADMFPNKSQEVLEKNNVTIKETLEVLGDLVRKVIITYDSKKREKAIVDFNDLEHLAIKALSIKEIGDFYRNKYEFIFIDEYQDSNEIQETIVNKIKRDNNVFMVGDAKQSIYKFRLADVSLINSKMEVYNKNFEQDEINQRIDLVENYRSRKGILDATNLVLSKIMTKELGEMDYTKDVFLNYAAEFDERNKDESAVEINIVEKVSGGIKIDDENDLLSKEIEANLIIDKIEKLVENGEIYDCKLKSLRPIEYKDIVILTRGISSIASIYEKEFFRRNIPMYIEFEQGYYNSVEIKLVLDYLRLMDNFKQDIALISVLYSDIGGFSVEEIAKIKIIGQNILKGKYEEKNNISYCDCFLAYIKNTENTENLKLCEETNNVVYETIKDELYNKACNFYYTLNIYREKSTYLPISQLIWEIVTDTRYYYYVGALANGQVRQANLRLLVDKAEAYEKTSANGLYNFLNYIDKLGIADRDEGRAKVIGANDNVVRIMTIHKSKGLEFPIVFLANANSKFNKKDFTNDLLLHKKYGFAMKYRDEKNKLLGETIKRAAFKIVGEKEALSEEMRILYVALTRAMNKLYIYGSVQKIDKLLERVNSGTSIFSVLRANSYLDWICSAIFNEDEGVNLKNKLLNAENEEVEVENIVNRSAWQVNIFKKSQIENMFYNNHNKNYEISIDEFCNENNNLFMNHIDNMMNFSYKYKDSVNAPTKLSVTDLKNMKNLDLDRKDEYFKAKYSIPGIKALDDINQVSTQKCLDDYTGSEIGTLTHLIMQHLDFKGDITKRGISKQIERMVNSGLISIEEGNVIKEKQLDNISKLFLSDIGRRLVNSSQICREVPFVLKKNSKDIFEGNIEVSNGDIVLIQGIIDCYFYDEGRIVLIDYKTDSRNEIGSDNKNIIEKYKPQLLEYKIALETLLSEQEGKKTDVSEVYLYLFSKGEAVKITF